LGLKVTYDGLMIVGTPVGTPTYVESVLHNKVEEVKATLGNIKRAATEGQVNTEWLNPQGLYHLVRNCANQLLRQLQCTVDPALTRGHFKEVDDITMDLICYIFKIRRNDRTRVVRNRIVLPGSLSGLGMRT